CPVPTDHGIRLDDRQRAPNIGEQPIKADEYQSVDAADEKPFWRGPAQDIDLLSQHQDLRLKLCSRSEQVDEHPPDQSAKVPHQATTSPDSRPSASRMRFATGTADHECALHIRVSLAGDRSARKHGSCCKTRCER